MKTASLLLLTATCVIAGDAPDSAKDVEKLQGTWMIVSVHNQGKKEETTIGTTAVISGKKVTFTVGDDKDIAEFKIDSTKKPAWFDITSGAYKSVGIYQLDGDMLKVCLNQSGKERPTAFKSENDSPNERLFILKRGKS